MNRVSRLDFKWKWLCITFLAVVAGTLHANNITPGSTVIVVTQSELKYRGNVLRTAQAGETLKVVALNSAAGQVLLLVPNTNGGNVVASLPVDSVSPVDDSQPESKAQPAFTPAKADSSGYVEAADMAQSFKDDKTAASNTYSSGRLKIKGVVDRVEVDPGSLSSASSISLTLRTGPNLPKIKVKLLPHISKDKEFYRRPNFDGYWGYSWWDSAKIEFRVDKYTSLMAHLICTRTYTYSSSYNGSYYENGYRTTYRRSGEWFTLLTQGEEVFLDGVFNGMYLDILIGAAELHAENRK